MLTVLQLRLFSPFLFLLLLTLTACGDGNSPTPDNSDSNKVEETNSNSRPDDDVTPPSAITDLSQTGFILSWTAPGDDGAIGTAASYDIRYSTVSITEENWADAIPLSSLPVPQVAGSAQEFTVVGLAADTIYYFAIRTTDEAMNESALSNLAIAIPVVETDTTPPAAITDLSQTDFILSWTAPGDDGASGTATSYDIRYSTASITEENWASATPLSSLPAPQVAGSAQEFTVVGLAADTTYYFAMKTTDEAMNESALSNLASATASSGNVYYVSHDALNDVSWSTCINIDSPHCSGRTAMLNAVAGDTVYFRGGTYDPANNAVQEWIDTPDVVKYEKLPWNPVNIGTEGNPITFKAYPGETPVFLDNIYSGAFGVSNKSWIVWDGFTATIEDSPNDVILLVVFERASHCVIRNSHLIGVRKGTHHNSALIFLNYSNDILIENNRIHGMNTYEPGDGPDYIETAVNASGILNFYTYNMTIKNNDIYDNYLGIFDKDTEQNNVYLNNHIWGTNSPSQGCNTGIQINDQLSEYGEVSGTLAHNNLIRNCDIAISLYDGVGLLDGVSVYNNTIVDSDSNNETGIIVTDKARSASVYNNIIYGYQSMVRYYNNLADNLLATTISLSDHNIFYNSAASQWHHDWITTYNSLTDWNMATTFDANSSTDDPLFINAGSADPDDYKLTAGSPAIGAGQGGATIGAFPDGSDLVIGYRP